MRGLLWFVWHGYVGGDFGVVGDGASSDFSSNHLQCTCKEFFIMCSLVRHVLVGLRLQPFDFRLQLNDLRLQRNDLQLQSIERSPLHPLIGKLAR